MSFFCENEYCGCLVTKNQPENKVVVERRQKTYEKVIKKRNNWKNVEYTEGWEIVKEIRVCPKCFTKLTGREPQRVIKREKVQAKPRYQRRNSRKDKNPKFKRQQTSHKKPVVEKVNTIPIVK